MFEDDLASVLDFVVGFGFEVIFEAFDFSFSPGLDVFLLFGSG